MLPPMLEVRKYLCLSQIILGIALVNQLLKIQLHLCHILHGLTGFSNVNFAIILEACEQA
jgi:hypothetical protein